MATLSSVLGALLKRNWGSTASASSWTDDLGVSNAVQATSARQPTVTTTPAAHTALSFSPDGSFSSNADVMVASAGGASATPRYTLACGVCKVDPSFGNDGNGCVLFQIGTGGAGCIVYIYPALDNTLRAAGFSNGAFAWGANAINDGQWHTWIALVDVTGGSVRLYIDGTLQTGFSTGTGANINLSTAPIFIGATDATGVAVYQGYLGNIGVAQNTATFTGSIAAIHGALREWIASVVVSPASVLFSGKTVAATAQRKVAVSTASIPFAGGTVSTTLTPSGSSLSVSVSPVSIPFSGKTVNVTKASTVAVTPASVPFSGKTVSLRKGVAVSGATVPFTGGNVTFRVGRATAVTPASIPFSGKTASVAAQRRSAVSPAALAFSGKTVGATAQRRTPVTTAAIPFSGKTVAVTLTPVVANGVSVTPAAIAFNGGSVACRIARKTTVTAASIPFVGVSVATSRGHTVLVAPVGIPFAGGTIGFRNGRRLPIAPASIPFVGGNVLFRFTGADNQPGPATITLTARHATDIALSARRATDIALVSEPATLIELSSSHATTIKIMSDDSIYYVGDTRVLTATFKDLDGELVDPSVVWLVVQGPGDPGPTTYTYGTDDEVVRVSPGVFRGSINLDRKGKWQAAMQSPGPVGKGIKPEHFEVLPPFSSR